jgi:uncharacterized protein
LKITFASKKRALRPSSSQKDANQRAAAEQQRGNLNYALTTACASGDSLFVSALLKAGANPNSGTAESPLFNAINSGREQILEQLLQAGADPNRFTGPYPPILLAAFAGNANIIRLLAHHGADLNAKSRVGTAALHHCVKENKPALVELLLELGADPNLPDADGRTALFWAGQSKAKRIATILKTHRAQIPATQAQSDRLLRAGAEGNLPQLKDLLRERNHLPVDPRDTIDQRRFTPLMHAVAQGHIDCARFLISRGADIEATALPEDSVLTIAAEFGQVAVIQLLLKKGVQLERRNREQRTPLLQAAVCRQAQAMKVLLEAGADLAAHNPVDGTALNLSAAQKHLQGCQLLLQAGADVNFGGPDHDAPIFNALFNPKILQLFIQFGADLTVKNHQHLTPLDLCRKSPLGKSCAAILRASSRSTKSPKPSPSLLARAKPSV